MRIFYKQLFFSFLLFGGFVGMSAFLILHGIDDIVNQAGRDSVQLLSEQLRSVFGAAELDGAAGRGLEPFLQGYSDSHPQLHDFRLYDAEHALLFSMQKNVVPEKESLPSPPPEGIALSLLEGDLFQASWRTHRVADGKLAVAVFGLSNDIVAFRRKLVLRLYLVCVGGLIGAIIVSLIGTHFVKSPIRRVEKAMLNIENRRYGFRLKGKENDEFRGTYNQVNRAMMRLEQLDSVQRSAVRRKNMVLNELKTISRFLDVMAHEIKNPLHALVINIDVLKTKLQKSRIKAETKKHVGIIELEVEHLREVIDGFLNYVRPGVPQKERIKINHLIQDVCEMASAEAENSRVAIETRLGKGLQDIFVDKRQLQQALHNVMKNGLQSSSAESKLFVRSWTKGKHIFVSVRDMGPGIGKNELRKIFDLYFTTKKNGSGLGLPITKRIIEANGGEMQLESKVGKGTTVTFKLDTV